LQIIFDSRAQFHTQTREDQPPRRVTLYRSLRANYFTASVTSRTSTRAKLPYIPSLSDQHQDQRRDTHQWPSSTANHAQKQTRTSLPEKSPGSRNSPSPNSSPINKSQLTPQPAQETRGCILPRPRHRSPHKNTPVIKCIPSKVTWLRCS
jgi:hypothetical protein